MVRAAATPSCKYGQPYLQTAMALWSGFAMSVIIWGLIVLSGKDLIPNFGSSQLDSLYAGSESDLYITPTSPLFDVHKLEKLNEVFRFQIKPFCENCQWLSNLFLLYCFVNGFVVFIITIRFFEYLSFQKRLSMTSNCLDCAASGIGVDGLATR